MDYSRVYLYPASVDIYRKYWVLFYNAVILLSGNELAPRTNLELFCIITILILDLVISGNIFGNVSYLVEMSNRKSSLF